MNNHEADKAPNSAAEPNYDPRLLVPVAVAPEMVPAPSDRLYKFAAMTAGIFLLASLF